MKTALLSLVVATALSLAPSVAAQDAPDDEQTVRATIDSFMAAFDAKDGSRMASHLTEDARVYAVREAEGGDPLTTGLISELARTITEVPADIAEPLAIRSVLVDGPVAMVWADYGFYVDGEQQHCGVDVFNLVRIAGEWKIASITYSHIESACEDAPRP